MPDTTPLLRVQDLRVDYLTGAQRTHALRGVSFEVAAGEKIALVGESGSGKTTTAHAIIGLLDPAAEIVGGRIEFDGTDLRALKPKAWRDVRGAKIGLVPQDPLVSLDPVRPVGDQVAEVLRIHGLAGRKEAAARAIELLERTGITDAATRVHQYPVEFSGGMLQRVLIAAALAPEPGLLIADEPTSALDVTVQKRILDDLDEQVGRLGSSLLLVTHDLAVAAERADRILVFSQGEIVEQGPAEQVRDDPQHPYTKRLVAAAPSFTADLAERPVRVFSRPGGDAGGDTGAEADGAAAEPVPPLLELEHVSKTYTIGRGRAATGLQALDDVSLDVRAGETVALVGESGSGKSTIAKVILGLTAPEEGSVRFSGREITGLSARERREVRRRLTLVYQSPYSSLPPHLTVEQIISEPIANFGIAPRRERPALAAELIERVQLPGDFLSRLPAELSGGQRQRVAIARALAVDPALIVLDEPVSALDVTVQAQILDLLVETQERLGVSYLFITHDLGVVRSIAHRVVVLDRGRVQETGTTEQVLFHPRAEYTKRLVAAVPGSDALVRATPAVDRVSAGQVAVGSDSQVR